MFVSVGVSVSFVVVSVVVIVVFRFVVVVFFVVFSVFSCVFFGFLFVFFFRFIFYMGRLGVFPPVLNRVWSTTFQKRDQHADNNLYVKCDSVHK